TFRPALSFFTTPSCWSVSKSKASPSSSFSRSRLTTAYSLWKIFVKPRLGRRRCIGICPPSKPRILEYPETDLAPLCPRPEVLPRRLPIPRPTRFWGRFWPSGALRSLKFIALPLIGPTRPLTQPPPAGAEPWPPSLETRACPASQQPG